MREILIQHLKKTPLYYPLRNWVGRRRQIAEFSEWEKNGKLIPVPHIAKQRTLREYAKRYDLKVLVETGTCLGDMVEAMKTYFDRIYSIELSEELYKKVTTRFKGADNIELIHGDSGIELERVMDKINQASLFWLDGHYSKGVTTRGEKDTPIYEELRHILNAPDRGHVIIIDDARCYGTDPAYPTLKELSEFVNSKRSNLDITVYTDSIRITPNKATMHNTQPLFRPPPITTGLRQTVGKFMRRFGINPGAIIMQIMGIISYDRQTRTYVRTVMGHRMHVHPYDPGLSQALIKYGMREPESVLALMQNITPDMTIMDLGANIGFYVLLEAHTIAKGTGRIIAIEPFPENTRLLRLNVEANEYSRNVQIIDTACSNHTGTAKFTVSELSNCGKLTRQNDVLPNMRTIDVPTYTFTDLLQLAKISPQELDFLRMDIEGAEYTILPAILDALSDKESFMMFIEFHPTKDLQIHANTLQRLERMGYRCLNVVKEYVEHGATKRRYCPNATIRDIYTDDFFLQGGGIEVFIRKG